MPRSIIETATDLLSMDRLQFELRIPADSLDTAETAAFNDIITDAVDAVRIDSNIPILPEMAAYVVELRGTDVFNYSLDPFALNFDGPAPVHTFSTETKLKAGLFDKVVNFQAVNQAINDNSPIGKLTGYTDVNFNGIYRFTYRRGLIAEAKVIGDLRSMAVLRARAIFDGVVSAPERSRSAYERLLERVRYEGLLPDGLEILG